MSPDRFPELATSTIEKANDPVMEGLIKIMFKACEMDTKRRYPSGVEMHAELQTLYDETDTDAGGMVP